jgi:hypothetical protein
VLLVWAPLASLSLVGQEHGRTIPLADIGRVPNNCPGNPSRPFQGAIVPTLRCLGFDR